MNIIKQLQTNRIVMKMAIAQNLRLDKLAMLPLSGTAVSQFANRGSCHRATEDRATWCKGSQHLLRVNDDLVSLLMGQEI
jgi:hypothetical protein